MLSKRILRVILNDKVSSYGDLLQRIGECSLSNKRIQNMLIIIFIINVFILNRSRGNTAASKTGYGVISLL